MASFAVHALQPDLTKAGVAHCLHYITVVEALKLTQRLTIMSQNTHITITHGWQLELQTCLLPGGKRGRRTRAEKRGEREGGKGASRGKPGGARGGIRRRSRLRWDQPSSSGLQQLFSYISTT